MTIVKSGKNKHLGGNVEGGDPYTYEHTAAARLVAKFGIRTVLDVGCGEGHMVRCFQSLGCNAIGLDGLPRNAEVAETPTIVWDLTKGPFRIDKIDLVWCVEVAEHIDEEFVDNFIETVANGQYVVLGYAPPGQGGHHHVNEQYEDYWLEKMEDRGFDYLPEGTQEMKSHANGLLAKNGLLFVRRSGRDRT